jgi:hypothetical protein
LVMCPDTTPSPGIKLSKVLSSKISLLKCIYI